MKPIGRLHVIGTTHVHMKKMSLKSSTKNRVKPYGDDFGRRVQKLAKGGHSHGHNNQPQLRIYLFIYFHPQLFCANPWVMSEGGVDSLNRNLSLA